MDLKTLIDDCHRLAELHGYHFTWKNTPKYLMLIVTEVSEAMESWRDDDKTNFEIELVDVVIRVLHMVDELGFTDTFIDAIKYKMKKNEEREYHHGRVKG